MKNFWKNKKVFITGHTGFKGSWLCLWLMELGAKVTGYALEAPTRPSMFALCNIERGMDSVIGDIRDQKGLSLALQEARPDIVIHLAAQPLVRESYRDPVGTYETNVMGTVYLLEAIRHCPSVKASLIVTTDKCYENKEWAWGYRENDRLGGYDPYASAKACAEMAVSSYRQSFFQHEKVSIATARAGNVIGSGDWAANRLVSDAINALSRDLPVILRNPRAIRPWQHVLEALSGYMLLARRMYEYPHQYDGAWNFGPDGGAERTVQWVVEHICDAWGAERKRSIVHENADREKRHEACYLKLDSSKARQILRWEPKWPIEEALNKTVEGYKVYLDGGDLKDICRKQLSEYMDGIGGKDL